MDEITTGILISIIIVILLFICIGGVNIIINNKEQIKYCDIMSENGYITKMENQILYTKVCFIKDKNKFIEYDKWRAFE